MNLAQLKKIFFVFLFLFTTLVNAQQERFTSIETKLKELSTTTPGLNEKVELSVNGIAIQEFIRGIATTNNLNVSVDAGLTTKIVNNFSNVTVADVLLFLCKKYDLDINFIGNIMSISQFIPPPTPIVIAKYTPKQIKVTYDKNTNALNLDLTNDSLALVAREITKTSEKNVVFSPDLSGKMVSGYIQNTDFNSALEKLAFANDLKVTPTKDNFYLIEKAAPAATGSNSSNKNSYSSNATNNQGLTLKSDGNKLITLTATNVPISDILSGVSAELKNNYFLFTEPKGNTSLNITNATFEDFLNYLFNGTDYTFKKEGEIYLIGDRTIEGLRTTKVISLMYRTVDKMIDFVPAKLKDGVDLKIFPDLNSLIVSGSSPRINELENFIRTVDRVVPVISIEVILIDVKRSHSIDTKVKVGLNDKPVVGGGMIVGGDGDGGNINFNANVINSILSGMNGYGLVNLGNVGPNFYVSLKASETNGDIDIRSTPSLATLNGHEATMKVGEKRFYQENNTNTITTQSTTTVQSVQYKSLDADFALSINPIVSGDEQITLDISVTQTTFTDKSSATVGSPYNTATRDFKSLIRVKNGEMIMLGGLEQENKTDAASGLPWLSRIPVLKWIFSSRLKAKSKSKLTIFIKPTVIY
jgi:type IV pilus assembly protein PilQ